jgi:hypothetical protein
MRDATERYIWLNPYTHIDGKQWHAYVTDELPDKKLPRGVYLVHNQVQRFRAWVQTKEDNLIPCKCNFAVNKNAKLNKHYRVRLKDD